MILKSTSFLVVQDWNVDVTVSYFNRTLLQVKKKKKIYLTSCIPLLAAILIIIGLMILVIIDINFYRSVLESFP